MKYKPGDVGLLLNDLRERCAKIAESEPEPEGDMPPELYLVPLEEAIRGAVRATKRCIAARIRTNDERT